MSARSAPADRWRAPAALLGMLLAAAAATWAQAMVRARPPWPCLAAFAGAALVFAIASRLLQAAREAEPAPPPARSRRFMRLFSAGVVLCAGTGVAVYFRAGRIPAHVVWAVGLLTLAASALVGDRESATRNAAALPSPPRFGGRLALPLLLALLAVVVFGWDLTSLPVEVHGDDAEVGLDAIRLMSYFDLFGAGWFELPRFHALPTAIGLKLFGINLLGLRATSAALGTGCVLLLFAIGRRLWNTEVGVLAALLLIFQRFFIHLSRTGYHYVDTPFLSLLAVWLLLRVWQDRRLGAAVWAGMALGLGIQTYYASRLVPVLFAATWGLWLRGTARPERRARLETLALVVLAALAVAAPMFGFFAHDWGAFWERTRDTSLFTPASRAHLAYGYHTDNLLSILLIQLRAAVTLFNFAPDNSVQYGLGGPLFEPFSAALFVLGVALLLCQLRERRVQLLAVWTVLPLIAGAALTIDTPFYPRISGLVPFAVLLVALALHGGLRAVRAAVDGRGGVWLAGAIAAGTLALVGADNLRTYFVDYAPRYRHSPSVEIAGFIRRHGVGKTTYMVGGAPAFFIRHGTIAFLTYGLATRDVEDLERFLRGGPPDAAISTFIVMPQGTPLIPQLEAAVGPLDLQTHRNAHGDVAFLTAIPQSAHDTPDPPELLVQRHEPGPGGRVLEQACLSVARGARALLIAAAALAALLALWQAMRRPRRPGVTALAVPWRERWMRWRARLFGPDDAERRSRPPRWFVIALLLAILAAATALRVYRLADLPAGFFCDEAGNGYNAYSLLRTGRDETGALLPLYVWSFGTSYKNPLFLYSAALPMAVLGATELAVRLTAALYGAATVLAMFFLGRALMGPLVGLAAALLLAICPWHLHFSRIGYELITLPFFFTLATTQLVRWTQGRRTLAQAAVLFGLCLYTYVPAKLFVPLFLAGSALLYRRELRARWRETVLAAGLLVVTALPVVIFDVVHHEQSGTYFRNTTLLARDAPAAELLGTFAENYAAFFAPEFLFEASNDRIIRHSVSDHGQLYPFFAPLLLVGIAAGLLRGDRALRLPLLWLALYPLAPALMNEIPSASRGFIGAPAFCLVAAIGAGTLLRLAAEVSRRRAVVWTLQGLLAAAGLAVAIPAAHAYWRLYRDEYPLYSAKYYTGFQYGHRQVVDYFRQVYDQYDLLLLTTRKSNQPDVFLRFYDGLHQPARRETMPPFEHREKMQVGSAESYQHFRVPGRHMLFAVLPEEVPLFADPVIKERILAPDHSAAFVLVEASGLKDFVSSWRVAGLFPEDDHSPPPDWPAESPPPTRPEQPRWRLLRRPFAGVALNDVFTDNADHACAWAVNFVRSDGERDLRVVAGFDDRGEVWVNGDRVALAAQADPDATLIDSLAGVAHVQAGWNRVAVRACEETGDWRFYFRVENPDGSPAAGIEWRYPSRRRAPG